MAPTPTTFTEADQSYRKAIDAVGSELAIAFSAASNVNFDPDGTDITIALLLRLRSFYDCQDNIKTQLNKIYCAPAADFFVESVCFFLKVVLAAKNSSLEVASEKNIVKKRGAMRPDISIWCNGSVIAVIECKTQLGWNRTGWQDDFKHRQQQLHDSFPNAKMYLLVMTGSNWGGFGDDNLCGKQFFVLLNNSWPRTFEPSSSTAEITHSIEILFSQILKDAETSHKQQANQNGAFVHFA